MVSFLKVKWRLIVGSTWYCDAAVGLILFHTQFLGCYILCRHKEAHTHTHTKNMFWLTWNNVTVWLVPSVQYIHIYVYKYIYIYIHVYIYIYRLHIPTNQPLNGWKRCRLIECWRWEVGGDWLSSALYCPLTQQAPEEVAHGLAVGQGRDQRVEEQRRLFIIVQ